MNIRPRNLTHHDFTRIWAATSIELDLLTTRPCSGLLIYNNIYTLCINKHEDKVYWKIGDFLYTRAKELRARIYGASYWIAEYNKCWEAYKRLVGIVNELCDFLNECVKERRVDEFGWLLWERCILQQSVKYKYTTLGYELVNNAEPQDVLKAIESLRFIVPEPEDPLLYYTQRYEKLALESIRGKYEKIRARRIVEYSKVVRDALEEERRKQGLVFLPESFEKLESVLEDVFVERHRKWIYDEFYKMLCNYGTDNTGGSDYMSDNLDICMSDNLDGHIEGDANDNARSHMSGNMLGHMENDVRGHTHDSYMPGNMRNNMNDNVNRYNARGNNEHYNATMSHSERTDYEHDIYRRSVIDKIRRYDHNIGNITDKIGLCSTDTGANRTAATSRSSPESLDMTDNTRGYTPGGDEENKYRMTSHIGSSDCLDGRSFVPNYTDATISDVKDVHLTDSSGQYSTNMPSQQPIERPSISNSPYNHSSPSSHPSLSHQSGHPAVSNHPYGYSSISGNSSISGHPLTSVPYYAPRAINTVYRSLSLLPSSYSIMKSALARYLEEQIEAQSIHLHKVKSAYTLYTSLRDLVMYALDGDMGYLDILSEKMSQGLGKCKPSIAVKLVEFSAEIISAPLAQSVDMHKQGELNLQPCIQSGCMKRNVDKGICGGLSTEKHSSIEPVSQSNLHSSLARCRQWKSQISTDTCPDRLQLDSQSELQTSHYSMQQSGHYSMQQSTLQSSPQDIPQIYNNSHQWDFVSAKELYPLQPTGVSIFLTILDLIASKTEFCEAYAKALGERMLEGPADCEAELRLVNCMADICPSEYVTKYRTMIRDISSSMVVDDRSLGALREEKLRPSMEPRLIMDDELSIGNESVVNESDLMINNGLKIDSGSRRDSGSTIDSRQVAVNRLNINGESSGKNKPLGFRKVNHLSISSQIDGLMNLSKNTIESSPHDSQYNSLRENTACSRGNNLMETPHYKMPTTPLSSTNNLGSCIFMLTQSAWELETKEEPLNLPDDLLAIKHRAERIHPDRRMTWLWSRSRVVVTVLGVDTTMTVLHYAALSLLRSSSSINVESASRSLNISRHVFMNVIRSLVDANIVVEEPTIEICSFSGIDSGWRVHSSHVSSSNLSASNLSTNSLSANSLSTSHVSTSTSTGEKRYRLTTDPSSIKKHVQKVELHQSVNNYEADLSLYYQSWVAKFLKARKSVHCDVLEELVKEEHTARARFSEKIYLESLKSLVDKGVIEFHNSCYVYVP